MNLENLKLAEKIVSKNYIEQASNALNSLEKLVNNLLSQRKLPENGWEDVQIETFLNQLAQMDTNNFQGKVGVGERESRIYSNLVQKRNYYMGHGIGRSGDVAAIQPKAAGSSLILKLTKFLTKDSLKIFGIQNVQDLLLLPLATGMALSMTLLAFSSNKPAAKYVIWSRIDQKTCLKCIKTANLIPVVVEGVQKGDEIVTNLEEIKSQIEKIGAQNVLCVLTTTSCFAPRVPDKIEEVAKICQQFQVFHLINNAYGLQCKKIVKQLNQANQNGRVDAVVQSTDKNFMVPVGGAFIFCFEKKIDPQIQKSYKEKISMEKDANNKKELNIQYQKEIESIKSQKNWVDLISEIYPGRASMAPIMDLFITLLSLGKSGLQSLLAKRQENLTYGLQKLNELAIKLNERVLETPNNTISLGMTLKNFHQFQDFQQQQQEDEDDISDKAQNNLQQFNNQDKNNYDIIYERKDKNEATQLGGFLYSKRVMGCRILTEKVGKKVCGIEFQNYGSNLENYSNLPYITMAVAIGMKKEEIDIYINKLEDSLKELGKKLGKKQSNNNTKNNNQ